MAVQRRQTQSAAPATKQASGKTDAFAAKFNKAVKDNPGGNFESLPVGVWECLASKGGILEKDGKEIAWIDFTVVQEGASCFEKSGRAFYQLEDEEGNINDIGVAILARALGDMQKLDIDIGLQSKEQLKEILASFEKETVWVTIRVTVKKGYTNIRLEKVMEDQDNKPELDNIPL